MVENSLANERGILCGGWMDELSDVVD